ncbi:2-succinyl-5-enolpyruvyl-6-hydroxy-3-cyclohexene-1-carboxylate synthase [Frankliniella fusca]|uniref:2-succinyl-5-enolpyruvyl-6-hydroxy-3-cyclohexene-1-carboxylate synthase n=1 Tax=Frankliniella fusca TaxID=407009 RepID=A0AAE1GQ41_9NEOP|nr:2-succinyl-5-enolpyruvyl-6-hydroxy-3-cyclohexene-1-carboxylate synthase [Frankliniella fusca]
MEQLQKDKARRQREERKIRKLVEEDARRRKAETEREVVQLHMSSSESDEEVVDDPLFMASPKRKRGRKCIITPEVVAAIDAAKLSSRCATKIIAAVSESVGVPVADTNLNHSSLWHARERNREETSKRIKASFTPDNVLTLHWDGKIVPSLSTKDSQDRQAIVVTGVTTSQLLGAVPVPNGKANEIVAAVMGQVSAWGITEQVKALSFDTTSVNTGWKNGAAVGIERALGKDLLWLPCRHHVFERVLEDVFHTVMGPSTGPEVGIFRVLQQKWASVDHQKFITYTTFTASKRALTADRDSIIKFCEEQITSGQPRDDYLEFLELVIIFLGGIPPAGVRFRPPGPIHSARWMAKAIYCLKMSLFRRELGLSSADATNLLHIAIFIIKVYVKGWFLAPHSISAPSNDLQFLKERILYEKVNMKVAKAAQNRFGCHLWYLSEELVGFSVFDESLDDAHREEIVQGILNREGTDDSPKKRKLDMRDVPKLVLGGFSTQNTLKFFEILGINTAFFQEPVSNWKNLDTYSNARIIVSKLAVINDHAERAVFGETREWFGIAGTLLYPFIY